MTTQSHNGHRQSDPQVLEADIARQREDLAHTIQDLEAKLKVRARQVVTAAAAACAAALAGPHLGDALGLIWGTRSDPFGGRVPRSSGDWEQPWTVR